MNYSGRKILVTGGTGFIGGHLVERLVIEQHANVRVLVHDWRKAVWACRVNAELVSGDIRDVKAVENAMEGCEIVFHCVGVGGSSDICNSINVGGTRNVLECAYKEKIERLIYLSSIAVHGPNPPDNADENVEFVLTGAPYGDSKVIAEKVVWDFWQKKQLPIVVIRPTFVWGPRSPNFTVVPVLRMKARQWYLVNQGQGSCHAVYIDNLVDVLLKAGVNQQAIGQAFLITDGVDYTWSDFFISYAHMLGFNRLPSVSSSSVLTHSLQPLVQLLDRLTRQLESTPTHESIRFLVKSLCFVIRLNRQLLGRYALFNEWDIAKYARRGKLNISKARTILKYEPSFSLIEGMKITECWLRDQRYI